MLRWLQLLVEALVDDAAADYLSTGVFIWALVNYSLVLTVVLHHIYRVAINTVVQESLGLVL